MSQRQSFLVHIDAPDHASASSAHKLIQAAISAAVCDAVAQIDKVTVDVCNITKDEHRDQAIRELAETKRRSGVEIEFNEGCPVSEGDDNGAYVLGWVWVPFAGTALDTDTGDDDPDLSSYGAWLEDTGEDDSFVGDWAAGIPGTREKYETACREAGVEPNWEMDT